MNAARSVEPFPRPNHKAKPHPRPTKWRRAMVRAACEQAVEAALMGEGL